MVPGKDWLSSDRPSRITISTAAPDGLIRQSLCAVRVNRRAHVLRLRPWCLGGAWRSASNLSGIYRGARRMGRLGHLGTGNRLGTPPSHRGAVGPRRRERLARDARTMELGSPVVFWIQRRPKFAIHDRYKSCILSITGLSRPEALSHRIGGRCYVTYDELIPSACCWVRSFSAARLGF